MTRMAEVAASPRAGGSAARLTMLALAQFVGWGALFFAPIVASPMIAADLGLDLSTVMATFAAGTIVSALAGVLVGRLIDRGHARWVISAAAALGALGLLLVASAQQPGWLTVGFVLGGLGQAGTLYQAAFAVIVRRQPAAGRQRAMTIVTLVGGLSSPVFAPLVVLVGTTWGWRTVFGCGAALLAATVPMHWFAIGREPTIQTAQPHERPTARLRDVLRTGRFWRLVVATAAVVCAINTVTLAIIPLLAEKGADYEFAAVAFGLVGAAQVLGRGVFLLLPSRSGPPWLPLVAMAVAGALVVSLLAAVPGPLWLLAGVAMVGGALRGSQTLLNATAVVHRWGAASYGVLNGVFIGPATMMTALAPGLGPLLADALGSYALMAAVMAGVALAAAVTARWS